MTAENGRYLKRVSAVDLRSLALMRIGLSIVLIYDLLDRLGHFSAHYLDSGAFPYSAVQDFYAGYPTWSLHTLSTSATFVGMLFGIHIACAVALLIGYKTRVAVIGTWVLQGSLMARVPLLTNGADVLMIAALFWSMFLPIGSRFSVDSRLNCDKHQSDYTKSDSIYGIATFAIVFQLVTMYFVTGLMKLNDHWLHGSALETLLAESSLTRPLGDWLTGFPSLLSVMTIGVLLMELLAPLLLLSPWKTHRCRGYAVIAFLGLHAGIELTMDVPLFSFVSCAILLGMIPTQFWNNQRTESTHTPQIQNSFARITCVFCLTAVVLYNFMTVVDQDKKWPLRANCTHLIHQLRLDQQWSMFDNPDTYIYRFSAPATLENGEQLDLLHHDSIVNGVRQRPDSVDRFTSQRWMLAMRQIVSPSYRSFAAQTCEFVMRNPHAVIQYDEIAPISNLELSVYIGTADSDNARIPQLLAFVDRQASGKYKNGMRHGVWITHHANGKLQSEGRYDLGLEQGNWKYYYENGDMEAKGPFVDGKLHGNWTFYYTDGKTVETLFRDNKQIQQATTENGRLH